MKRFITYTAALVLCLPGFIHAQDARFSQYFNNPLILNPALAGNGIEHMRISGSYRSQWNGLGEPFTTQGFAVDKIVSRVGIGGYITRFGAGDAGIRTIQAGGNLSYNLPVGKKKIQTITAGVQLGLMNKSFDISKLTFDNQYTPDIGYDPNMSSGEDFSDNNVSRTDITVGAMWQYGWNIEDIRFKPYAGVSFAHVNKPKEIIIEEQVIYPMKTTVYAGAGYMVSEKAEVRPSVMYLHQGPFTETTFGAMINYLLPNSHAVEFGMYDRINDAVIAYAGYQMNRLKFGFSYDANTSTLGKSGNGLSAFELSIAYSPEPKKKKSPEEIEEIIQVVKNEHVTTPIETGTYEVDIIRIDRTAIAEIYEDEAEVTPATPEVLVSEVVAEEPVISDSDADGIPDNEDKCPYINGLASTNGCPDSDADGIIDMEDACPMDAGTLANNGCPDPEKPTTEDQGQTSIRNYNNILFDTGTNKLRTDDIFDIIERAIDLMYAFPGSKAILSGHTDNEGGAEHNMRLSDSRTRVVKKYMMKQGIEEERIETVSYGESMPLENNDSEEGRQQNRRVEINIVK